MSDEKELTPAQQARADFVGNLEKLEAAERAQLKRNAGRPLSESRGVMGMFYKQILPPQLAKDEIDQRDERYFLVATLYPFEKRDREKEKGRELPTLPRSFGLSLRQIRNEDNQKGLDRRMARLLDADDQQLPFLLRQAVLYLTNQQQGRVIDWHALTYHVNQWSHPDRWVQRNWARDYYVSKES